MTETIFFILFAGMAVGGALAVVLQRDVLYSALALIVTFAATAATFILLHAQFMAAIQMIVYAGAIIVLFVFVIMLLNVRTEESRIDAHPILRFAAVPLGLVILGMLVYAMQGVAPLRTYNPAAGAATGTVEAVGFALFQKYLLPFEATSVLILMAIVGSIVLAKRASQPAPGEPDALPMHAVPPVLEAPNESPDEPVESLEKVEA